MFDACSSVFTEFKYFGDNNQHTLPKIVIQNLLFIVKTKKHVNVTIQFEGSFLRNFGLIGSNVKYMYNAEAS